MNLMDRAYLEGNQDWLPVYQENYTKMRLAHRFYNRGWFADATTEHRVIPRTIWWMAHTGNLDLRGGALDLGTYDGTLVRALRGLHLQVYGQDDLTWTEMWDLLSVSEFINKATVCPVVMAFNIAHRWKPTEFVARCGSPELLLADREVRTPHINNKWWYDDEELEKAGFKVILHGQRDLLARGTLQRIVEVPRG